MKSVRGYILVLTATIFWGASAVVAKLLFNRLMEPIVLVQMRVMLSCVLIVGYCLLFRPDLLHVRFGDSARIGLLGVLGVAGSNFTYYYTIQQINVSTAILIQYTAPLLVLAYAALTQEESLNFLKVGAAIISLVGCYFAVGGTQISLPKMPMLGLASGIASAFCWAFATVYVRRLLRSYSVWTILAYSFVFATLFWFLFVPPWDIATAGYTPGDMSVFVGFALISVLIPHSCYFIGVRYITASRAIITGTFEPIVAIVGSFLFLGDLMAPLQVMGAILVITAIAVLQVRREEGESIECTQ
jgi:drug/metabolite transporter (DMT)-like permease